MSNKLSQSEIDALVASLIAGDAAPEAKPAQAQDLSAAPAPQAAEQGPSETAGPAGPSDEVPFESLVDLGPISQAELDAAIAAARAARAGQQPSGGAQPSGGVQQPPGGAQLPLGGVQQPLGGAQQPAQVQAATPFAPAPASAASAGPSASPPPASAAPSAPQDAALQRIPPALRGVLLDIELTVSVELGKSRLPLGEILAMGPGSVITLDKLASEPLVVKINGLPAMKAEVLAVGEKYGIRIVESNLQNKLAS